MKSEVENVENKVSRTGDTSDVLLENTMPQAEYMYGCTPTALAMLLGYYDLYGYADGTALSNLIAGNITVNSRGTDGSAYNMNAFDTVLGSFTASEEYVYRFFSRDDTDSVTVGNYTATTPAQELAYSFVNGGTELDTSSWNCLADYIGTGQYWRGNDNLSTTVHYSTLEEIVNRSSTVTITSGSTSRTIDYKYTTMLYGLELYVRSRGYQLDYEITGTYAADVNGGSFTFEDYMAEIDAGRAVLVSIEGHSMVGYGYNAASREIIFDDTYTANQSMVWDGMYFYSGENRSLKSITVIGFKTSGSDVDLGFAESAGGDEVILANVEEAASSQTNLYAGDTLYLSFSVKNLLSDASGTFDVGIYVNGTKVRNVTVNGIAGNSVQEFTDIEIGTVAAGHHSLKVVIDDGNRIQESSGANNEFEQAFQVLQSGAAIISGSSSIASGTTLDHAYITSGGRLYVVGGSANAPEVMGNSGGYAYVYASAGGVVTDAAIMEYGYGVARSGGVLESAVVSSRGQVTVSFGGSTLGNRIAGGSQFVYSGGVAENTIISGGYMSVRGGIARNTEVYDSLYCSSAATLVSGVTVHESGFLRVYSSAVASDVDLGGSATIGYGGKLYDARLSSGASMTLISGGSAIGVTASGAWINLSSGGVVSNAVLNNNGSMSLRNGAVSSDTKVAQGGVIYCWPSGSLKGTLDIAGSVQDASTATVSGVTAYNFELNAQRDAAFLEFTTGGIQSGAVITVDVSNGWGSYLLVDGDVSNISSASITVKSGQYSANAVVGGSAVTFEDGRTVALSVNDSGLLAQVSGSDSTAPAAPSNLQKQLAGNVLSLSWTAVSDFSGVSYVIEYANNAAFTNAVSVSAATNHAEVRMPNGDWYIRVKSVDGAGNQSAWSSAGTQSVNYVEEISGSHASTVTVENDVNLLYGASITASFPAALNVLGDNFTVNLAGGNTLSCSSIRNAAILFGEDAYWPNASGNPHYSGNVNFNGENISLYSDVGSCITAAGIVGYDLNVAFTGDADGSESITFEATNRAGVPGNFAGAIIADNELVITGEFAGSINSHFDFSDVAASNMRSASVYGFSAGNDLIINDDLSADIFAYAVSENGAYAYGLDAADDLVVSGEISGIIAACGNDVARAVAGNNVSITVSGTLFAGKSADGNDMETMNGKLENFAANKDELLSLRHTGGYAVYAYGTGTLNFKGDALSIGKIYVRNSASVITVSDAARLYGDISAGSSGVSLVFKLNDRSLDGTRVISSAWNRYVNITVDGSSLISSGTYKLVEADSLSTISKIALTVGGNTQDLTVDESVTVGNTAYSLAKVTAGDKTTLTLTVTKGSAPTAPTATASTTEPTNRDVTVTATFSSDSTVKQYKIGEGNWTDYTAPFVVSENNTIYFRAENAAGRESTGTLVVANIDKVPPVITISCDDTMPYADKVHLTANVTESNLASTEYAIGSGSWQTYTAPVEINANGTIQFRATDTAGNVTVSSYAVTNIGNGEVKIYSSGVLSSRSPIASGKTLTSIHRMDIYSGGTANSTIINSGGRMNIYNGGVANSTTVNSRGYMYIYSGGVANSTTLNGSGYMWLSSGGVANDTTLSEYGAVIYIRSGGVANSTTVNSSGVMRISSGGVANSTTINSGGSMYISYGGVANSTTISCGYMNISSGGVANSTTVDRYGYMRISSGGVANSTTVNSGGDMYISSGGVANSTTVNAYGYMTISSGVANNTTINSGGGIYIYSGGVANSTTVSRGYMYISSGGTANSTTVNSGGRMYISSGGVHRGSLQIASGAYVLADSGGKIDFTVAERTASDGYLINNLSRISGAPTYTITVSATQASGTYKLAQGAASFSSTISVGDGSTTYGSITVNGDDLVRNGVTYSLDKADGNLTLTVTGGSAPGVSNLTGNADGISWNGNGSAFVVEYSKDNFASVLQLETVTSAVDTYQMPAGSWQVRVDSAAQTGFTATAPTGSATQIISDADGDLDVFFARTAGTWDAKHLAKHLGDFNGWQGTKERVALTGKNIITDVFSGSTDANVLVLTDDSNGDALFLDDMYSALGNQARLGNIDEIRAGAGNDVIDLTSPKFAYLGDEMTVFGGEGDDVIWANSGENTLYGDAGNDRIIGGAGNDFIIGGAGNDALHGGGGNDTFCFGANWGTDIVEQLANGKVILRFETGSMSNWNATTKTYTSGNNTVTVTGTSDIELYFGTASTLPEDAFAPASSEKIFEQLA